MPTLKLSPATLRPRFFEFLLLAPALLGPAASSAAGSSVIAWGDGLLGQTNMPSDLTNAVAIAAGSLFELALRDDGRVAAWGDNSSGAIDFAAGLTQVVALAAGSAHGVALLGDGAPRLTVQPRNQSAWTGSNTWLGPPGPP